MHSTEIDVPSFSAIDNYHIIISLQNDSKPEDYQWLTKAQKRKIRKGIQKRVDRSSLDATLARDLRSFPQARLICSPDGRVQSLRHTRGSLDGQLYRRQCRAIYHHFVCGCEARVLCHSCSLAWDRKFTPWAASQLCASTPPPRHGYFDALCPMHSDPPDGVTPTYQLQSHVQHREIQPPVYLPTSIQRDPEKPEYYLDALRTKGGEIWGLSGLKSGGCKLSRRALRFGRKASTCDAERSDCSVDRWY